MKTNTPSTQDTTVRKDIIRAKHRYGIAYGIAAGLGFALSNWGMDAYLLNQVTTLHPWLKLIVAASICVPVGGLAGWLSTRLDKPLLSVLLSGSNWIRPWTIANPPTRP